MTVRIGLGAVIGAALLLGAAAATVVLRQTGGPSASPFGAFRDHRHGEAHAAGWAPPRPAAPPPWRVELLRASAEDGAKLAASGRGEAVLACGSCHGEQGVPEPGGAYPRLAGLSADYLAKQLGDYTSGARENEVMSPMAKALSARERAGLALHFASLPAPEALGRAGDGEAERRGRELHALGDQALGLPACGNCHAPRGAAGTDAIPGLYGQPAEYVSAQLRAWREGTRRNDEAGVMAAIASRLRDEDADALGVWYAGAQPQQ